jgi:hypothetical protein
MELSAGTAMTARMGSGEDLERHRVEVGLEVVVGEHEVEIAPCHHRVRLLHGASHPELERDAARHAQIVQDGVPSLRGQRRALLIEHPERQGGRLAVGGPGREEEAGEGDENFR